MTHPLCAELDKLALLLRSHPHLASEASAVRALDKVKSAVVTATALLEGAVVSGSPDTQEISTLLSSAFGPTQDEKGAKDGVKMLLSPVPSKKAGTSFEAYMGVLAQALVRAGKFDAARVYLRRHIERPRFDLNVKGDYELLKQVRNLGRMDEGQIKAAKKHLLGNPELVVRLCSAAGIAPKTKTGAAVKTASLVNRLMEHGKSYAENAGE